MALCALWRGEGAACRGLPLRPRSSPLSARVSPWRPFRAAGAGGDVGEGVSSVAARFWSKVNKDGPTMPHMETPCWVWTDAPDLKGYGRLIVGGRLWKAHRVAWLVAFGCEPHGLVLHACDNPACVRIEHLRVGTHADNVRDRVLRGRGAKGERMSAALRGRAASGAAHGTRTHPERFPRGERHPHATLSDLDVAEIRSRRLAGERQCDLAAEFGVSRPHISNIVAGKIRRPLV